MGIKIISTNSFGLYKVFGVPGGTGYTVTVYAAGYVSTSISSVTVQDGHITDDINISLQPIHMPQDYSIGSLNPDPNFDPNYSQVMQGGTTYRYYKITNSLSHESAPGIQARIEYSNGDQFAELQSDTNGVVKIPVDYKAIGEPNPGDSVTLKISQINEKNLPEPISFQVEVIEIRYTLHPGYQQTTFYSWSSCCGIFKRNRKWS